LRQSKVDEQSVVALTNVYDGRDSIDVPLDEMTAEPVPGAKSAFQIHSPALGPITDRCSIQRRCDGSDCEPIRPEFANSEARAVDGDALAQGEIGIVAFDAELSARGRFRDARNDSDFFD